MDPNLIPVQDRITDRAAGPSAPDGQPWAAAASGGDAIITADGCRLPLRSWRSAAATPVRAVVLAVHGFNEYSAAFAPIGPVLAEHGIPVYAYDQRSFGATDQRGVWPGHAVLIADLRAAIPAIQARHPDAPLYVLGESMGAAVAIAALGDRGDPLRRSVRGAILISTAVWGGSTLNPAFRAMLMAIGALVPRLRMTKPYSVARLPSDNMEAVRAFWNDPLVITATRISAVAGLVRLVDAALAAVPAFDLPGLVQFGGRDGVNPPAAVAAFLDRLPRGGQRVAVYPDGWHMLLRDRQARVVIDDILAWIADPSAPLPSGSERR